MELCSLVLRCTRRFCALRKGRNRDCWKRYLSFLVYTLQLVCRPLRMGCASVGMLAWVTFCRDLAGKLEGQRFLSTFCGDLAWKMGGQRFLSTFCWDLARKLEEGIPPGDPIYASSGLSWTSRRRCEGICKLHRFCTCPWSRTCTSSFWLWIRRSCCRHGDRVDPCGLGGFLIWAFSTRLLRFRAHHRFCAPLSWILPF